MSASLPEATAPLAGVRVADLSRVLGANVRADTDPLNATNFYTDNLFGVFVAQGLQDPEHYVASLMQGGLGMPDREYYLSGDKEMVETRKAYEAYVAAMLKQAGIADAEKKAKSILALEAKIAKAHAPVVDSQDVHKANNPWEQAAFSRKAPGMDWTAFFAASGLAPQKTIVAWQPRAITGISRLVSLRISGVCSSLPSNSVNATVSLRRTSETSRSRWRVRAPMAT